MNLKRIYHHFLLFSLLGIIALACNDEKRYIDPMILGIIEQTDGEIEQLTGKSWNVALVSLQHNRQRLLNVRDRIDNGEYSKELYDLENSQQSRSEVVEMITYIDHKIDSVWGLTIKDSFEIVDGNSAGVKTFGARAFQQTTTSVGSAYSWLKAEYKQDTADWQAFELVVLQEDISKLLFLNSFSTQEVEAYVTNIKAKLEEMKMAYQTLASDVNSAPYYTVAQKQLYQKLNDDLTSIEQKINDNISLETSDDLDLIDRDLEALVYFKNNNYTSPAQKPLVWGEISSITELRWLSEVATADECTGDWVLTADIDAAETHRWNQDADEKGFQQIKEFNGSFDGQYHMISGLLMTKYSGPTVNREGMFQNFTGTIKNLALVNLYLQSPSGDGGQGGVLVGHLKNGTVQACFTHGARQLNSQSGGFVGRTAGAISLVDCFAAVDCDYTGAQGTKATNTSSFLGLPVGGPIIMKNCYTIGVSQLRALLGFGAGVNLVEASGLYFDSSVVGITEVGHAAAYGETIVRLEDEGVVTDLESAKWGDLANFEGFDPEVWEIMTVTAIDEHPRPYLKGFNYEAFEGFLSVE